MTDLKQLDPAVWQQRFDSLDQTITELLTQAVFTDPQAESLKHLLKRLQAFAKGQFNFFFDGFNAQTTVKLVRSRAFHPDHVFKATLDQIETDVEVIRRAADQRHCNHRSLSHPAGEFKWILLETLAWI